MSLVSVSLALPVNARTALPSSAFQAAPVVVKQGKDSFLRSEDRDVRGRVKSKITVGPKFQEIKLDLHSTGTASNWEVKSGDTTVRASEPVRGQFTRVEVIKRQRRGFLNMTMSLTRDSKNYVVTSTNVVPYGKDFARYYNDSRIAPTCIDDVTASAAQRLDNLFGDVTSHERHSLEARWACEIKKRQWLFMDASCGRGAFGGSSQSQNKMIEGLAKLLASPTSSASGQPEGLACLESQNLPVQSARIKATLMSQLAQADQALRNAGHNPDAIPCDGSTPFESVSPLGGQEMAMIPLPERRLLTCREDATDLNAYGQFVHSENDGHDHGAHIVISRTAETLEQYRSSSTRASFGYNARDSYASTLFHELVHASGFSSAANMSGAEELTGNIERCCMQPTDAGNSAEKASACQAVSAFVSSGGVTSAQQDPVDPKYGEYERMFSRLAHSQVGSGFYASQGGARRDAQNGTTDYVRVKDQIAVTYGPEVSSSLLNSYFETLDSNKQMMTRSFRQCVSSRRGSARDNERFCASLIEGYITAINDRFFKETCPTIVSGSMSQSEARTSCRQWIAPFQAMIDPIDIQLQPGYTDQWAGYYLLASLYGGQFAPTEAEVASRRTCVGCNSRQERRGGIDSGEQTRLRARMGRIGPWVTDVASEQVRMGPIVPANVQAAAPQAAMPPVAATRVQTVAPQVEVLEALPVRQVTALEPSPAIRVVHPAAPAPAPAQVIAQAPATGATIGFGSAAPAATSAPLPPSRREIQVSAAAFESPVTMSESNLGVASAARGSREPAATVSRGTAPLVALQRLAENAAQSVLPQANAALASAPSSPNSANSAVPLQAPAQSFANPFNQSQAGSNVQMPDNIVAPSGAAVARAGVQSSSASNVPADYASRNRGGAASAAAPPAGSASSAASRSGSDRVAASGAGEKLREPTSQEPVAPPAPEEESQQSRRVGPVRLAPQPGARVSRVGIYSSESSLKSFLQSTDYNQVRTRLGSTALGAALIDFNIRIVNDNGQSFGSDARNATILSYCQSQRRLAPQGACR